MNKFFVSNQKAKQREKRMVWSIFVAFCIKDGAKIENVAAAGAGRAPCAAATVAGILNPEWGVPNRESLWKVCRMKVEALGLTVEQLLKMEQASMISLVCGQKGIQNEIKGVTIIEAPDIVSFIKGGELLLTGLYAFQTCSVAEYRDYIYELKSKKISGVVFKRGRAVEDAEEKISLLKEFSEECQIPLMEVPFGVSFQTIMALVMEQLFNEEVTLLKYYKTIHDNFAALAVSGDRKGSRIADILQLLDQLVSNPVALYDQNQACFYATDEQYQEFSLSKRARKYQPGIFSNYTYWKQSEKQTQYVVEVQLHVGVKLYLVITEVFTPFTLMDCIAVENAIVELQHEFARRFAVSELEKKFQNDILYNVLYGKITSEEELEKSTELLGLKLDGSFRVIVFGVTDSTKQKNGLDERIRAVDWLEQAVQQAAPAGRLHRDADTVVLVRQVDPELPQQEHRKVLRELTEDVQQRMSGYKKQLRVRAGAGKIVKGLLQLHETYQEAKDALLFVDIVGDMAGDGGQIMMFSDLGIFKLLCQLDDPAMMMEYIPEPLQKLCAYKKPQRDDLLITLKTYLDRNQNLSKTAQDLFVHYKTAAYRIEKIAKITGIDFDDANEVLNVRIGLVVYRMMENYKKGNR